MKLPRLGEFKVMTLRECPPDANGETPDQVHEYYLRHIVNDPRHLPDVETLYVICLSTRRKILGHTIVATGTIDTCLAHPREVFRPAIVANAAAIILVHNHPSGDPTPSEADVKLTRDMIRGGQLLRVELLDHLVEGTPTPERPRAFVSLRELGYFFT